MDTLLAPILTFAFAGAGAYFGSYLKKKGENLATHEDLDKVVAQVESVTQISKTIEARISDEFWQQQRRWDLKRDTIFEVMKRYGELEAVVALLSGNVAAEQRGFGTAELLADRLRLQTELKNAQRMFGVAKNQVTLACGDEANRWLSSIQIEVNKIHSRITSGESIEPRTLFAGFGELLPGVYEYLRRELGIQVSPQHTGSSAGPNPY